MLTWEELQKQAKFIVENQPTGDYEDISFNCRTGGAPDNKIGLPEVHRCNAFVYNTVRNGNAYRGEVVIRARFTGAKDRNERNVYEAENGQVFVYRYIPGDPCSFDYGLLEEPKL